MCYKHNKILKSDNCVNFKTLIEIISASHMMIEVDESNKQIKELFFITRVSSSNWLGETIYKSHIRYNIRPTSILERMLINFIKNLTEDRPDGKYWIDDRNGLIEEGEFKYRYYEIYLKSYITVFQDVFFQQFYFDTSFIEDGVTVNSFVAFSISDFRNKKKCFYIRMTEKEKHLANQRLHSTNSFPNYSNRDAFDTDEQYGDWLNQ
jgi:hypothetical protein